MTDVSPIHQKVKIWWGHDAWRNFSRFYFNTGSTLWGVIWITFRKLSIFVIGAFSYIQALLQIHLLSHLPNLVNLDYLYLEAIRLVLS